MAIEAKVTLLKGLEQKLSGMITAADLGKVMSTVSDLLEMYQVEQAAGGVPEADDLMETYMEALQIEGRSPKTIERYRYLISRMMRGIQVPTRSVTVYHLRQYLAKEKARGISDSTLEGIRQVFSSYFTWLTRERLIEENPTANLGTIRCQKKIKAIYSDVDIERLKFACRTVRDRAIISFLLSTGCRISEMTQLNRDAIDPRSLECIVHGKGNKERTVYFDPVTGMLLQEYLSERTDTEPALFLGKGVARITPGGVRAMLVRVAKDAGVEHVHPHKFRRTMATNIIRHGMPIQEAAAILGHDKLDTTMQYVVLDKNDIKSAYRKYA